MVEDQRRTQILEAEQAVRLLAKSLAGADASRKEFDTLTAILSSAAGSVTAATTDLSQLRRLIAIEHEQASAAIASTVAQARASLVEATERLTQLGAQAATVAVEQASSADRRMRELAESTDRSAARLDARLDMISQMIPALQKDLGEQVSKTASNIETTASDSSKRMLELIRLTEESLRNQAAASASETTKRLIISTDRIESVVREQAATTTSELRQALDGAVQLLLGRVAEAQQHIRSGAEVEYKRSRTLLVRMYVIEGAVVSVIVLGSGLLLWWHW